VCLEHNFSSNLLIIYQSGKSFGLKLYSSTKDFVSIKFFYISLLLVRLLNTKEWTWWNWYAVCTFLYLVWPHHLTDKTASVPQIQIMFLCSYRCGSEDIEFLAYFLCISDNHPCFFWTPVLLVWLVYCRLNDNITSILR